MSKTIFTLVIICSLAGLGKAQTGQKIHFFCNYGGDNRGVELCTRIQSDFFPSNEHAERAVEKIVKFVGLKRNFVLVSCPGISNAVARTYDDGVRYILYDNAFMEGINSRSKMDSASVSILAHEVGHHLQGHTTQQVHTPPTRAELQMSRLNELEADEFSGFIMFKIGATLAQAQAAMSNLDDVNNEDLSTHPKIWRRLQAIKAGYDQAKSQLPIENLDTRPSAEAFYLEALSFYGKKNYRQAIDNFTLAIGLNSKYSNAFYGRGLARDHGFHDYFGAIEDYDRALRLDGSYKDAWYARGVALIGGWKDYRGAIHSYDQALKIDASFKNAWYARGLALVAGWKDYRGAIQCYDQALKLDPHYAMVYTDRGNAKYYLNNRAAACEDYRQACSLRNGPGCKNVTSYCGRR